MVELQGSNLLPPEFVVAILDLSPWGRAEVGTRQNEWEVNGLDSDQNQQAQGRVVSQKIEIGPFPKRKQGCFL